jgi:hypothetical protein
MIPKDLPLEVRAWGEFPYAMQFLLDKPTRAEDINSARADLYNAIMKRVEASGLTILPHLFPQTISDLIRNGIEHSDSPDPIELQFRIGETQFVVAYKDGGSYFGRTDVKSLYERKQPVGPSTTPRFGKVAGHSVGTGIIYDLFEPIHIDTTHRTFYGLSVIPVTAGLAHARTALSTLESPRAS